MQSDRWCQHRVFYAKPDDIGNLPPPTVDLRDHGRPHGLSAGHRRPGQALGRCLGYGTATDTSDAQVSGDAWEAHGCIEVQVTY